jgi:prephenate dehydrogenase
MQAPGSLSKAHHHGPSLKFFVVVGGLGDVGALVSKSLAASGMKVEVVDQRLGGEGAAAHRFLQADAASPDNALRSAISAADCVIVCLPP